MQTGIRKSKRFYFKVTAYSIPTGHSGTFDKGAASQKVLGTYELRALTQENNRDKSRKPCLINNGVQLA